MRSVCAWMSVYFVGVSVERENVSIEQRKAYGVGSRLVFQTHNPVSGNQALGSDEVHQCGYLARQWEW